MENVRLESENVSETQFQIETSRKQRFFERIKNGNEVIFRFDFGFQVWQFVFWG